MAIIKLDNKELKKHVSIIHCSNNLSLLQRKISNILLFHAHSFLQEREEHKISIKELCKYLEYRGYNYEVIKKALKALISTVIEWNVFDDNTKEEDWTASSILASVNIKNAICTYAYSPRMKKLLYSPVMYGKINLSIQANFASNYGLALYENCIRYRNLQRTKTFSLIDFRKIMGVSDGKYLIFRDFKKRIIDKAVDEINKISDIEVKPQISRVGREVTGIYFGITLKDKNSEPFSNDIECNSLDSDRTGLECIDDCKCEIIRAKLKNTYCINDLTIKKILKQYDLVIIEQQISQIEKTKSFIDGKIANLAGFLIDALKKDYKVAKASKNLTDEKNQNKDKQAREIKIKENEQWNIQKNYDNYADNCLKTFLDSAGVDKINDIKEQFEKYLLSKNDRLTLSKYKKFCFENKIVRIFLRLFLNEVNINDGPKFVSIQEFQNGVN